MYLQTHTIYTSRHTHHTSIFLRVRPPTQRLRRSECSTIRKTRNTTSTTTNLKCAQCNVAYFVTRVTIIFEKNTTRVRINHLRFVFVVRSLLHSQPLADDDDNAAADLNKPKTRHLTQSPHHTFKHTQFGVLTAVTTMTTSGDFGNPLRKFKLVFLGEQSGKKVASSQLHM